MDTSINSKPDAGFVLPYVLVVIFILALASTIAVRSINASGQVVTALNDDVFADQRLASAEAQSLYIYLSSAPVKGGIDTSHTPWTGDDILDGFDVSRLAKGALWTAGGGRRVLRTPNGDVDVTYRDVSGLVLLNGSNPKMMEDLLHGLGLKKTDAKIASAKLGDYIDTDRNRRFRGGERSDYRLKRKAPPANGPIRAIEEVYRILDWDALITPKVFNQLRRLTTLTTKTSYYRKKFLDAELGKLLGLDDQDNTFGKIAGPTIDFVDEASFSIETPTKLGRFTFSTPKGNGQTKIRVVEYERLASAPGRPFRRHVVFEETGNVSDNRTARDTGENFTPVFTAPDRTAE